MLTKGEIANRAAKELKISGLTTGLTAGELVDFIQACDLMVASWREDGIRIPYQDSPTYRDVNANQTSGVEDNNILAVTLNLALEMADSFGKQATNTLITRAAKAYTNLFSVVLPTRDGNGYLPKGSGLREYGYQYCYDKFFTDSQSAPIDPSTQTLAVGDIYDYTIDWSDWLDTGASVVSYTIAASSGLTLLADNLQGNEVYFKIAPSTAGLQTVSIEIVSSEQGREDNRVINFNVLQSKSA